MEYVIITPAKNEARFIEHTLKSVTAQTVRPKKWVVVDDGSTDGTPEVVEAFCERFEFIHLVRYGSTGERRSGGSKVVRAFNVGYEHVRGESFDFVVKLDADLLLPPQYFEKVIGCFESNPKVGLCGGYCVVDVGGRLVPESYSEDHVRGAFKAYRRECFDAIGGLKEIWSWDGVDEFAVDFRGWILRVIPVPVVHLRTTSQEYSLWRQSFTTGREWYRQGADLRSLALTSVAYARNKPVLLSGIVCILGYAFAMLGMERKVLDKSLQDYINSVRHRMIRRKLRKLLHCRT